MASTSVGRPRGRRAGEALLATVAEHGSAGHPYAAPDRHFATRDLSDVVHFLCTLHGRHPGVVDHAIARTTDPTARAWLEKNVDGFAIERLYLTRLVVAAGPIPSTPGSAQADATRVAQHHAIGMLAQSERNGCALGAAAAVVADWHHIRRLLDLCAQRLSVEVAPFRLSDEAALEPLSDSIADSPGAERAFLFGAAQMLVQHRGMWDLLESRQQARDHG